MVKIVILGDPNIGKSCLISRYVNSAFSTVDPTIGCNYFRKEILINNFKIKLDMWDTAGQEKYRSLTPMYYRNADIILLCFDLSEPRTLRDISNWNNSIKTTLINPNAQIVLVGTKLDIKNLSMNELIEDLRAKYSYDYYETSAKTGENIDETFLTIVKKFLESNPVLEPNFKASISLQKPEPTSSYCRFF
jgi:small GTP-binding protein